MSFMTRNYFGVSNGKMMFIKYWCDTHHGIKFNVLLFRTKCNFIASL